MCIFCAKKRFLKKIKSLGSGRILVGFLVLVFSNNSATFQALLKQGLSRSLSVTSVVSSISYLCQEKELSLSSLIPGILNVLADSSRSRNVHLPGEWEICPADWQVIHAQFPIWKWTWWLPLSAGSLRSPFIHTSASEVDAWSLDWNQWKEV